jgi:hypothetical protein
MWLDHLRNLIGRSWSATTAGYGTTTLGFILWTLLLSAVGWWVNVAASWYKLRKAKAPNALRQALRDSLLAGKFLTVGIGAILLTSYAYFFVRTVYQDHQLLVNRIAVLDKANADLTRELEVRKHSMVTNEPVFTNTISLLTAFDIYRHADKGKPCVVMITAPTDSNPMPTVVAQFSNWVSDCTTFGPMDSSVDPDVERRARDGMIPTKVVFHAAQDDKAADRLFNSLEGLIQLKRSYDLPSAAERTHLYSIPTPGQEDLIWLQFGSKVQWNEQRR